MCHSSMYITTTKKALEEAIYAAQRVAPTNPPLPVLSGVLLSAKGEKLTITGTSLNTTIISSIAPEEILDEGEAVLPAKHFYELVKRLPDGIITLIKEEGHVKVLYGKQQANVKYSPPEEFPVLPEITGVEVEIDTESLRGALQKVTFACATDEIHGILTGVFFCATPFGVEFVASDRYRLSYVNVDIAVGDSEFKVSIPKTALEQLKLFPDKKIKTVIGENMVAFQGENLLVASRLLTGKFINYNAFSKEFDSECVVNSQELLDTLSRAALLENRVILEGDGSSLLVSTAGEKGSLYESIARVVPTQRRQ
ncbi:DNA polymerase III subunit beta [Desulfallas sp. Bu1-1]|uniref:DNA polymerase III subunit beta n=1 Tax=Desulfallas sp. Bu1-1 TaxID=2787620 RepID=UPI0018A04744|nr:DNA polymerase III subunit beta [Desulfallas sp. Bu1-1]MBF7084604.1 DNA polymerase III subunit beta [Desulfallas sp. Bu1-1]